MFPDYVIGKINDSQVEFTLSAKFPYYKKLSIELQEIFKKKLQVFLQVKKFVPRQDFIMSDEARILICACAVRLTLGFESFYFTQFEYILVYPKEYQNPITKNFHRGETNLAGFMCFSYKDILLGISEEHDNFNLGIHEFSHALRLNSFKGGSEDVFFDGYFPKIIATGVDEYYRIKNGHQSIFRKYAGANLHEFFPVIVEHWFENPEEFKQFHPELFNQICILLNQEVLENHIRINVREEFLKKIPMPSIEAETLLIAKPLRKWFLSPGLIASVIVFVISLTTVNFQADSTSLIFPSFVLLCGGAAFLRSYFNYKQIFFYNKGFSVSRGFSQPNFEYPYGYAITAVITEAIGGDDDEPLGYANEIEIEYINSQMEFYSVATACEINKQDVGALRELFLKNNVNVLLKGFHGLAN